MIRTGIIGCGKIADTHAAQIGAVPGCEIVGVCDREKLMARQLSERYPIARYFDDVSEFLETSKPDVVHITTPPQSHFELARTCLDAGVHVYVEKPFTLNAAESIDLIDMATARNLKITVGHDDQFTHATRTMRELVRSGYLGGPPVHMESYYCYDLKSAGYAKALLSDRNHWVRRLPGQLLHNVISHGICRITEFLESSDPDVVVYGFTSPYLKSLGENELIDELRVIIHDGRGMTACFIFSSQMRPSLHQFRIYGPKNALIVDHDQQTVIKVRGERYKSYLERFVPPLSYSSQYLGNFTRNIWRFLRSDFHMKSGMRYLIEQFYRSIAEDAEPPIAYREIVMTSKIMDTVFENVGRPEDRTSRHAAG